MRLGPAGPPRKVRVGSSRANLLGDYLRARWQRLEPFGEDGDSLVLVAVGGRQADGVVGRELRQTARWGVPFAFVVMFAVWWRWGRDPDPGRSVAPLYEPPPNISPAEAGTLIDDRSDPRDITSTLIDLLHQAQGMKSLPRIDYRLEGLLYVGEPPRSIPFETQGTIAPPGG